MHIQPIVPAPVEVPPAAGPGVTEAPGGVLKDRLNSGLQPANPDESTPLRDAFNAFVGESFYGQMLKAMRQTVGKPAYFHGGRAEEVFRGQLDQVLSEKLAAASGNSLAGPMFDLFNLQRG